MLPRPSTNICPKDLTRDMRGFFNSLPRVWWAKQTNTLLSIEPTLKEVGLTLPDPPKPAGNCASG